MEILLLALLLTMSGNDPERWKRSLSSALTFYRENRELLAMLAQASQGGIPAFANAQPQAEQPQGQEKKPPSASQPAEEPLGSILEQFLKNHPV